MMRVNEIKKEKSDIKFNFWLVNITDFRNTQSGGFWRQ